MCTAVRGPHRVARPACSSGLVIKPLFAQRNSRCRLALCPMSTPGLGSRMPLNSERLQRRPATGTTGYGSQESSGGDAQGNGGNSGSAGQNKSASNNSPVISSGLGLVHVLLFAFILIGGVLFVSLALQFRGDMEFEAAVTKVLKRIGASIAFRQLVVISSLILLVRFGLSWFLKAATKWHLFGAQADKNKLVFLLKESVVSHFVRATLAITFVISAANVLMRLKRQLCQENAWQAELGGDITVQRRWEAYDKLGTFGVYALAFVFVVQAMGLEVTSVLAIGGVGGLAIGLAGREIFENLFNGFLILTSNPFEVGDEVSFVYNGNKVEGMVMDIGWYRTAIRSYEREVHIIPNAVFSKNTVLNITRKGREWRFFELISLRVQDVNKASAIVADCRKIIKNDARLINSLHKRVYLDKITLDECKIYISFYVDAPSRDVYMSYKQDFLLGFVDCVHRNGAALAQHKLQVEMLGIDNALSARGSFPAVASSSLSSATGLMPGTEFTGFNAAYEDGFAQITPQISQAPANQLQVPAPLPVPTQQQQQGAAGQQQQQQRTNGKGNGGPGPGELVHSDAGRSGGQGGNMMVPAGVGVGAAAGASGVMAPSVMVAVNVVPLPNEQYFPPRQQYSAEREREAVSSGSMMVPKLPSSAKQLLLNSIEDH